MREGNMKLLPDDFQHGSSLQWFHFSTGPGHQRPQSPQRLLLLSATKVRQTTRESHHWVPVAPQQAHQGDPEAEETRPGNERKLLRPPTKRRSHHRRSTSGEVLCPSKQDRETDRRWYQGHRPKPTQNRTPQRQGSIATQKRTFTIVAWACWRSRASGLRDKPSHRYWRRLVESER